MEALIECLGVPHPKARRAVVAALGEFKEQAAMNALAPLLESDASYFVEAEAARAVARTERPGAFDPGDGGPGQAVSERRHDGPGPRRSGRPQGRAGHPPGQGVGRLRAPPAGPGRRPWPAWGSWERGKRDVVDFIQEFVDDPWLRARIRAIDALQELKDDRAVPALSRRIDGELDGRVVRRCREAIAAIRRGRDRGDDARKLREDLEKLQEENRKLKDRLDKLEAKADQP